MCGCYVVTCDFKCGNARLELAIGKDTWLDAPMICLLPAKPNEQMLDPIKHTPFICHLGRNHLHRRL